MTGGVTHNFVRLFLFRPLSVLFVRLRKQGRALRLVESTGRAVLAVGRGEVRSLNSGTFSSLNLANVDGVLARLGDPLIREESVALEGLSLR